MRQRLAVVIDVRIGRIDGERAARRIDHLDNVAARLRRVLQALRGIIVGLARQDGDAQRTLHRPALGEVLVEIIAQLALGVGQGRIDDHVLLDGLTPQQHAVHHRLAIGQRQLDRPFPVAHAHRRLDHPSQFALAIRGDHLATVNGGCGTHHLDLRLVGNRVQHETDLRTFQRPEGLDRHGMQRRGPRTGIHLRLDGRNVELGKGSPLFPTQHESIRHSNVSRFVW